GSATARAALAPTRARRTAPPRRRWSRTGAGYPTARERPSSFVARQQLLVVVGRRVVKRHRTIGQTVDELVHDLGLVVLQLDEAAGRRDFTAGDDVARVREN